MNTTYELNNLRKDSDYIGGSQIKANSPVVEVFAAMVNGESIEKFGKMGDKAVEFIKELGTRAENGDFSAVAELNTLRRFVIETPILEEMKLLGIFGSYKNVGFDETVEREVYKHVGERSRVQAAGGDVVFPAISKEVYPVAGVTISGGYAVDYRRVALGDMTKENEGMEMVRTDIRNRAVRYVVEKVYNAIKNATGVKYFGEFNGLTKTGIDAILTAVRRNGRPTVIGDYAILSQFTPWAGYVGTIGANTITGISQKALDEIAQNGLLSAYNGAVLAELQNPYNEYDMSGSVSIDDGTNTTVTPNFGTLLPAGLGIVVPAGAQSPIATWTRGGLTSFTGNNVHTGKVENRFDIEVFADIAKGQEHKVGMFYDAQIGGID